LVYALRNIYVRQGCGNGSKMYLDNSDLQRIDESSR
jgi:hypothetical protein